MIITIDGKEYSCILVEDSTNYRNHVRIPVQYNKPTIRTTVAKFVVMEVKP